VLKLGAFAILLLFVASYFDSGEITANLKLKRSHIMKKYDKEIEKLFV